jgi:hypothetical protein
MLPMNTAKPLERTYACQRWAERPAGMEHRFGRRIPCSAPLRVTAASGAAARGRMRDVSMSGAFIETSLSLPLHSQITIEVLREDGSGDKPRSACVVRSDATGFGIEWLETADQAICPVLGCSTLCAAARSFNF